MTLGLEKATNARDLGGLLAADGRRVRTGLLYRSNALDRLTDADLDVVAKLNLACLIDFRSAREVAMVGADRLPSPPPAEVLAMPVSDPGNEVLSSVTAVLKGEVVDASAAAIAQDAFGRVDADVLAEEMLQTYRWLATSGPAREAWAATLRFIADPAYLPMLFHCTAGKDRTGWLSAVVLSILGVDRSTIVEDYLRTNELSRDGVEFVLGRLEGRLPDPRAVLPMLEARAEYLAEGFAAVEQEYGDVDTYLREGLYLDEATLAAIRAVLLEPADQLD